MDSALRNRLHVFEYHATCSLYLCTLRAGIHNLELYVHESVNLKA